MAERNRSSVWIHALGIKTGFFDHRERLRGERLVQFDHIDVRELQAGEFSAFGIANTGPRPISSGLYPAVAKETYRASGVMPTPSRARTTSPLRRRAIRHLRRVARRGHALHMKRSLERARASIEVSARGPSSTLKAISVFFGFTLGFDPFGVVKLTGTATVSSSNLPPDRRNCLPMAAQGKLVARVAGNAKARRHRSAVSPIER